MDADILGASDTFSILSRFIFAMMPFSHFRTVLFPTPTILPSSSSVSSFWVRRRCRKKNNQKTLDCRVKVVEASVTDPQQPDKPSTPDPVQINVQVSTQADLEAVLKNPSVTSITLDTTAAASFNIPSGQYANVDLTVNAPNADVVNNAKFKSVTVKAISSQIWTEKAAGNSFCVEALKARFIVDTGASVAGITITGASKTKVPVSMEAAAAGTELTTVV